MLVKAARMMRAAFLLARPPRGRWSPMTGGTAARPVMDISTGTDRNNPNPDFAALASLVLGGAADLADALVVAAVDSERHRGGRSERPPPTDHDPPTGGPSDRPEPHSDR